MAIRRNIRNTGNRLNRLIEDRMSERISRPLIKNPKRPVDESTKISKIIKTPELLVKTGKPLKDNILITKDDKKSEQDLINLIKPLPIADGNVKNIIDSIINPKEKEILSDPVLDVKDYNEEDARRIYIEEIERRQIEDERFQKIKEAFADEIERRDMFREELKQMKIDFEIYLKEKYPDIVGEKNIKDGDVEETKAEAKRKAEEILIKKQKLKEKMVKRVEEEKIRKQKEIKLVTNTKTEANVSTFLEEEIIIEQQEKKQRNPELDGLNKVQRTIKEMKEMEIRLGRPIVPHRDIVESDESDFDSQSATKETDILIKPSQKSPFENYDEKREILEVLRKSMSKNNGEEDLCVKYDKEDRNKRY
tara:strand:+ start:1975 stop:3066 length:1092 start_codon:yes stop_codon:yes gene_type:complete